MKTLKSLRVNVACIALFSMLFMQLAVGAYACPMMITSQASVSAMANCDGMDADQSTLCHLHATGELVKQTADKPDLPQVQPFVPAVLMLALQVVDVAAFSSTIPLNSTSLIRSTAPPTSILHCCFRI
ncbi:hypothetical protein [Undibacterium sp. RuRC25W]|jgi:hypothetical protein|uniref:hypothetical protein n=1 Tax=Undibacterium sp. RuRC25W TaxID=3413047 RepID=UPI003BF0FCDD